MRYRLAAFNLMQLARELAICTPCKADKFPSQCSKLEAPSAHRARGADQRRFAFFSTQTTRQIWSEMSAWLAKLARLIHEWSAPQLTFFRALLGALSQ